LKELDTSHLEDVCTVVSWGTFGNIAQSDRKRGPFSRKGGADGPISMKELYDQGLKSALRYPARLCIMTGDGRQKFLASRKDARHYIGSLHLSSSSLPAE
ncbi:hypothetical protein GOODEAATRI_004203, partial [Goodea atripinnis]